MNAISVFFFLLIFQISAISFSQTNKCKINSGMDIDVLKKNHVNSITEFVVDKISGKKDTVTVYYLDKTFCPYKKVYKLTYIKDPKWMAEEFNANSDSTITIYKLGEYYDGAISKVYKKETNFFNQSKQKIKSIEEEHYGTSIITTSDLNPSNENDYKRIILKINNKDTVQRISYIRTPDLLIYLIEDKHIGKWSESEKALTTFSDGIFETYKRYVNGVLVNSYSHKDIPKRDTIEKNYNPLPYNDRKEITDTVFTKDISKRNYEELQNRKGSKSDFKVIKYYDPFKNEKIYIVKIYNPNGLLHSSDNIPESYYTLFEYK